MDMSLLIKFAKGNPGAATCLLGLLELPVVGIIIFPILEKNEIFGTDLYVFWSDICYKDYFKMAELCESVPGDLLKEACSKQDYSGRQLLRDYL